MCYIIFPLHFMSSTFFLAVPLLFEPSMSLFKNFFSAELFLVLHQKFHKSFPPNLSISVRNRKRNDVFDFHWDDRIYHIFIFLSIGDEWVVAACCTISYPYRKILEKVVSSTLNLLICIKSTFACSLQQNTKM